MHSLPDESLRRILGITFFSGTAAEAVERMRSGGLLVAPSAPNLKDLPQNAAYRAALLNSDMAIADSGFMVLLWNILQGDHVKKLAGPTYLRELLKNKDMLQSGSFWVMANERSARQNMGWLQSQGIQLTASDIYVAPHYEEPFEDKELLHLVNTRRPQHVFITIGGGKQEPLGSYLKNHTSCYRPSIHCIGAAIAFLSGDQVHIPEWALSLYLGWLFRCISDPMTYAPRYWRATRLFRMMWRYRANLPQ